MRRLPGEPVSPCWLERKPGVTGSGLDVEHLDAYIKEMSLTLPSIQDFSSLADVNPRALRTAYETLLQPCGALIESEL